MFYDQHTLLHGSIFCESEKSTKLLQDRARELQLSHQGFFDMPYRSKTSANPWELGSYIKKGPGALKKAKKGPKYLFLGPLAPPGIPGRVPGDPGGASRPGPGPPPGPWGA